MCPDSTARVGLEVRQSSDEDADRLEDEFPSSTLFEAGSSLVLELRGRDVTELPNFQHHQLFNVGRHTLWCGTSHPSALLVPIA